MLIEMEQLSLSYAWQMTAARDLVEVDNYTDASAYEEEPKDLEVGITIKNLTKIYQSVSIHPLRV